jgi:hypothetical protein
VETSTSVYFYLYVCCKNYLMIAKMDETCSRWHKTQSVLRVVFVLKMNKDSLFVLRSLRFPSRFKFKGGHPVVCAINTIKLVPPNTTRVSFIIKSKCFTRAHILTQLRDHYQTSIVMKWKWQYIKSWLTSTVCVLPFLVHDYTSLIMAPSLLIKGPAAKAPDVPQPVGLLY